MYTTNIEMAAFSFFPQYAALVAEQVAGTVVSANHGALGGKYAVQVTIGIDGKLTPVYLDYRHWAWNEACEIKEHMYSAGEGRANSPHYTLAAPMGREPHSLSEDDKHTLANGAMGDLICEITAMSPDEFILLGGEAA